jgi:hypothetical protein
VRRSNLLVLGGWSQSTRTAAVTMGSDTLKGRRTGALRPAIAGLVFIAALVLSHFAFSALLTKNSSSGAAINVGLGTEQLV